MSVKLTQEEIDKLIGFRQTEGTLIQMMGEIELKSLLIQQQKDVLKESFLSFQKEQQEFATKLQEIYGDGSINIDSGEFTPVQS